MSSFSQLSLGNVLLPGFRLLMVGTLLEQKGYHASSVVFKDDD